MRSIIRYKFKLDTFNKLEDFLDLTYIIPLKHELIRVELMATNAVNPRNVFCGVSVQVVIKEGWARICGLEFMREGQMKRKIWNKPAYIKSPYVVKELRLRSAVTAENKSYPVEIHVEVIFYWKKIIEPEPEKPEPEKPIEKPDPPEWSKWPEFNLAKWLEYALRNIMRDENPVKITPYGTRLMLLLMTSVYAWSLPIIDEVVKMWGLSIQNLLMNPACLITHVFLHYPTLINGVYHAHIAFNALFLYVFGDNVEEAYGQFKYILTFLVIGVLSGLTQLLFTPQAILVGASGAISGIMGIYLIRYPNAKIILFGKKAITAKIFLVSWIAGQILMLSNAGNIAVIAHISGFIYGILIDILPMKIRRLWYYGW